MLNINFLLTQQLFKIYAKIWLTMIEQCQDSHNDDKETTMKNPEHFIKCRAIYKIPTTKIWNVGTLKKLTGEPFSSFSRGWQ